MQRLRSLLLSTLLVVGLTPAQATDLKDIEQTFADAYITAKVEAAVLKAKVLDDESIPLVGINAKTINGVVTLSGDVKSNTSLMAILNRVNGLHGVKKIISMLRVVAIA